MPLLTEILQSLFSTTFFDFSASDAQHIFSPYIWVYPVVTIAITAIVMGCWAFFTRRRRKQVSEATVNEKWTV